MDGGKCHIWAVPEHDNDRHSEKPIHGARGFCQQCPAVLVLTQFHSEK